jgi:hypothetical protein
MTFAQAILQYYGIDSARAGVGSISSAGDGLAVNINLSVPDVDIPAIAKLLPQPAPETPPEQNG